MAYLPAIPINKQLLAEVALPNEAAPNEQDCKKFLGIMEDWIADKRFQRIQSYSQTRHWLDYQTFQEAHYSNFLAWVLDPKEGHGLGDYFIKRLLIAAGSCDGDQKKQLNSWIEKNYWPSLTKLETISLTGTYVAREISIDGGRIDLILVDPHNKLLILIERKDGHCVSPGQLECYEKWSVKYPHPEYQQLWLVLDSCENTHENINKNWLQLNDAWLISAISDILDRDQLPEIINRQLKEFRGLLSGEMQWKDDPYYKDIDDDIRAFAAKHSNDLIRLQELYSITKINHKEAITDVLPSLTIKPPDIVLRAVDLAVCNHWALNALLAQNRLGDLENQIEKEYPSKFFTMTRRDRKKSDSLYITLKRFNELNEWPFSLNIEESDSANSGASRYLMCLVFDINIDAGKTIPLGMWPNLIIDMYHPKKNQRVIRTAASQIENLDIESIRPMLKELLKIEDKITAA